MLEAALSTSPVVTRLLVGTLLRPQKHVSRASPCRRNMAARALCITISHDRGDESFADDLNMGRGIVSGRVALLLRSTEIRPHRPNDLLPLSPLQLPDSRVTSSFIYHPLPTLVLSHYLSSTNSKAQKPCHLRPKGEGQLRRRVGRMATGTVGREGGGHLRRIQTGTVGRNWPKAWGRQGGPSPTREWARREARRVGAEHRDNPSARWDWRRRGSAAQGQSRREQGERDSPGARRGGARRLGSGTVPAPAQGQLWAPISEELRDS